MITSLWKLGCDLCFLPHNKAEMTNYFSLQHRKDAKADVVPYRTATRKLKQK